MNIKSASRRVAGAAAALAGVVILGGALGQATASTPQAPAVPPEASDTASAATDVYVASFERYVACLAEVGHDVFAVHRQPGDLLYDWQVSALAVKDGSDELCYTKHLYRSDVSRQFLIAELRNGGDDSALRAASAACADRYGLEPNVVDFDAVASILQERGVNVLECLQPASPKDHDPAHALGTVPVQP